MLLISENRKSRDSTTYPESEYLVDGLPVPTEAIRHLPPSSWDQAVSTQLALGLEKGEFVSELNVDSLAKVYLACFAGVQVSSRTGVSREEPLSALRDLWIVLLAGLIPPEREAFARSVVEGAFAAHAS